MFSHFPRVVFEVLNEHIQISFCFTFGVEEKGLYTFNGFGGTVILFYWSEVELRLFHIPRSRRKVGAVPCIISSGHLKAAGKVCDGPSNNF